MPDFMAENRGQFSLAVHQPKQLPGDVDVAAGHGESIHHRRIECAESKAAGLNAALGRDAGADSVDVGATTTGLDPAKLLDHLLVLLRGLLRRGWSNRSLVAGAGQTGTRTGGRHEWQSERDDGAMLHCRNSLRIRKRFIREHGPDDEVPLRRGRRDQATARYFSRRCERTASLVSWLSASSSSSMADPNAAMIIGRSR